MTPPNKPTGSHVDSSANGVRLRAFIPELMPPKPLVRMEGAMLTAFSEAMHALGGLKLVASQLPDIDIFLYSYVRKEAVLSSQIEGTRSTLSEFLQHEATGAPGGLREDVEEVSNHVAALNHGMNRMRGGFPISNRLVREMHALLLRTGRGSNRMPGEFRQGQVWIGGDDPSRARFVPPQANYVQDLMSDLERFMHSDDPEVPPLLRAGYAHVQFETIHPFSDGNGRIGRILITTMLLAARVLDEPMLYLSLYFKNNREEYYDLLNSVRLNGDWDAWIEFFLQGVRDTAIGATETASRLRKMFETDRGTASRTGRRAGSVLRVHEAFMNRPVLTIPEVAKTTGLTFPTASAAVSALIDQGVAAELTNRTTNRVFVYTNYLNVLSEGTEVV